MVQDDAGPPTFYMRGTDKFWSRRSAPDPPITASRPLEQPTYVDAIQLMCSSLIVSSSSYLTGITI